MGGRYVSPAISLAAANAWSATRVTLSGGNTNTWLPVRGSVTLTSIGATRQPPPASLATLNGRTAVTWNTATGAYQGDIPDPTLNQTLMFIGRVGAANSGWMSITNAGTINTGTSMFWDPTASGTVFARRQPTTDATKLFAASQPVIAIAVLTAANANLYVNALTPATSAVAAVTFNRTRFTLGALATALTYCMNGTSCAEAAVWSRALSAAEVASSMRAAGKYYGVAIGA